MMGRPVLSLFLVCAALQSSVFAPFAAADAHAGHDHSGHDNHSGHMATPAGDMADMDMDMDHSAHSGHMGASTPPEKSMSGPMPPCATTPSMDGCATYMYPDARSEEDIEVNCAAMPFMVACNVWDACKAGDLTGDICNPFNILASTCIDMGMKNMKGCAVFTPMCLNDASSVVEQCQGAGIARLPDTMPTQQNIIENCGTHSMPGCEDCQGESNECPDTLTTLQRVCNAHNMEMCGPYNSMCAVNGDSMEHFCGTRDNTFDPPMRMYFHNGIRDIILFRKFVPENGGEYTGAIILCIAVGIIASALRMWRSVMEAGERLSRNKVLRADTEGVAEQSLLAMPSSEIPSRLGHGVLSFIILTLDYALMLVAMTFNTGIFFAVVAGLTLGTVLFRHIGSRTMERMQAKALLEPTANNASKHSNKSDSKDGSSAIGAEACKDDSVEDLKVNVAETKTGLSADKAGAGLDPELLADRGTDPACCGGA